MIVAGINVMLLLELMWWLLLELMCSVVMFVAGINVFYCDDCAEIDIRCRFVCCAAKFCFADATKPAAANWYSLPICVLRSEILFRCRNWTCCSRFVCCAAKFCFADATEPPAAIWYSLPICVLRSEILFRCRSWTSCSEVIFAAELCVVQRNCGANSGVVLAAELAACGEPVLAADSYNKPPRQEWLKC